jgi:hypothetical protein|tara:strand:+ start:5417 stop:5692 length:276 start_codon:yes stop_codon:yes gene_type:complete
MATKAKIPWIKSEITIEIEGINVISQISWWSKDYYIDIVSPFKARISGEHMMYSVPCKFVLVKANPKSELAILDRCIKKIIEYFQENYKPV